MCSVPVLPLRLSSLACLCVFLAGCVTTTETRTVGTFDAGGPGQYGEPAPDAAKPVAGKGDRDAEYKGTPRVKVAIAQLQEARGYHDDARTSYEKALEMDARSVDAIIGLARLDQIAGRTEQAEAGFQKAISVDSGSARSLDALGQFYVAQKRWDAALGALQRAMESAPTDKSYRFHYAVALAKSGRIDEARPLLVEIVGSAATHYNVGLVLHERGELAGAEEEFIAAILENPRMQQAQYWLNEVRRERDHIQVSGRNTGTGLRGGAPVVGALGAQPGQRPAAPPSARPLGPNPATNASWAADRAVAAAPSIEAPPPRPTSASGAGARGMQQPPAIQSPITQVSGESDANPAWAR